MNESESHQPRSETAAGQARWAALVASANDGILSTNREGVVETWNDAAERILGYPAAEMIGRSVEVLIPDDRLAEHAAAVERVERGEAVEPWRTVRVRKDGRRIIASITLSPIKGVDGQFAGVSQILRDLTRKAELDDMAAAIISSSDDAIIGKDMRGIIHSWNFGAERVFGYSAEEMIGQPITLLMPPDRQSEEVEILARLRRGERVDHYQTVRRRKDGTLIDVSVTISPIYGPGGDVVGASKIARDITAVKRLSRERERLLADEQAARQAAEAANRSKDEFLATLSHELRTPLNAILGWAQLLRIGSPAPEDYQRAMETIERNARSQAMLIDELLDMSRVTTGKLRLHVREVDLAATVQESVDSMRPAAAAKAIDLSANLDPRTGKIVADPNRLQQVMWNLLSNALRYTPKGGKVAVSLQRVHSYVRITVSDTGHGISPAFMPRLFTPFSQADASTTRRHGGLGLGLALVRHLVELHGGTARAASAGEGQGATFTVELPIRSIVESSGDEAGHRRTPSPPSPPEAGQTDLTGIKAMVVDDEADARILITRVLESHGAQVVSAASAEEALAMLMHDRPDVLLSDIGMPDTDGYQLIGRIRSLPREQGGETPAAALTAFVGPGERERALTAGFQKHVSKPAETAELVKVVADLVKPTQGGG